MAPCLRATQIALGEHHACALGRDGRVRCWGANGIGQLGDGTISNRKAPQAIAGLEGVTRIAVGESHSCALRADRTVACWGYNFFGQIDGVTIDGNVLLPLAVAGIANVTAIALGTYHSCALLTEGTLSCWGDPALLGGTCNPSHPPVVVSAPSTIVGLSHVRRLAAARDHTCAVRDDGTVSCWGDRWSTNIGPGTPNIPRVPTLVAGIDDAVDVSVEVGSTCVLHRDGTVSCWWHFAPDPQVADALSTTPTRVPDLSDVVQIAHSFHTCALRSDGRVLCWGLNGAGELGDGTSVDRTTLAEVPGLANVTAIAVSPNASCALDGDGVVYCWGNNGYRPDQPGYGIESATPWPILTE